jgi:MFS family permease
VFRFLVGICLAGIYPVGMKLIVTWAPERTGSALAYLVAMLILGTALPHALRMLGTNWPWQYIITSSSILALVGALLIHWLGDGPHLVIREAFHGNSTEGVLKAFQSHDFRSAVFGYFGHMWELYAFWTIVPLLLARTSLSAKLPGTSVAGLAFAIIAAGAFGAALGGRLSHKVGSAEIAALSLVLSGLCCLSFGLAWHTLPASALLGVLLLWGVTVPADSPQFSALIARSCPPHLVGAALAIQISIGFAITMLSISITTGLFERWGANVVWILLPGPILGLVGFYPKWRREEVRKD